VPAALTIAGALLAGLMLGVGTTVYVVGQILERRLKDTPDLE
jgi:uncharacterized protein YneF (UPF0154 family)